MMKLDYAGGEVLISDALSHALVEFSAHIARSGGSDNLSIPVLTLDGIRGDAEVVVGPASQLLSSPTDAPEVDLDDSRVVAEIVARTTALKPTRALPLTEGSLGAATDLDL
jgi:hypothetical protein